MMTPPEVLYEGPIASSVERSNQANKPWLRPGELVWSKVLEGPVIIIRHHVTVHWYCLSSEGFRAHICIGYTDDLIPMTRESLALARMGEKPY